MSFAQLIDKEVFSAQRRYAPLTWLFMHATHLQVFQVMTEFFITNQPLTMFTFLIVRMLAESYITIDIHL